ncbi:MAG: Glycine-rich cell wall structural protein precursor, partial [Myxococcaceae bacterium]|nr:Glycine-rich cell wall structural protein precursor [Myxococcaceae bacterium]
MIASLDDHVDGQGIVIVDGGSEAEVDSGPTLPPGCDGALDPKSAPCQVANETGVFVSPQGVDTQPGTRQAPLHTITAGIKKVLSRQAETGQRLVGVFVCEGAYTEALAMKGAGQGVSVFGGFSCAADWAHTGASSTVKPAEKGYALRVEGIPTRTMFQDLVLEVAPVDQPGESSVVAFAVESSVDFKRVVLIAGDGATGADGAPFTGDGNKYPNNSDGYNATAAPLTPGGSNTCNCPKGGTSNGGFGNMGAAANQAGGGGGVAQSPADPTGDTGVGATASCSTPPMRGSRGQARPQGLAAGLGALTTAGWEPASGTEGAVGGAAQGGGGGGGGGIGAGGGGGCGGCGGAGGNGGRGGGASIGILLLNSKATFSYCRIKLGRGGAGGGGGNGQDGLAGGKGGTPAGTGGCAGAPGGTGAGGNGGDGGSGGIAVAIVRRAGPPPKWGKDTPIEVPNNAQDLDDQIELGF